MLAKLDSMSSRVLLISAAFSAAEKAAEIKRTREDIESNYANMIAHEPAKADLFRLELAQALKEAGL